MKLVKVFCQCLIVYFNYLRRVLIPNYITIPINRDIIAAYILIAVNLVTINFLMLNNITFYEGLALKNDSTFAV